MKSLCSRSALSGVLLFASSTTFASGGSTDFPWNTMGDSLQQIQEYLGNLGEYLGYNLQNGVNNNDVSQALLQVTVNAVGLTISPALQTVFGAFPVNTSMFPSVAQTQAEGQNTQSSSPYFVPSSVTLYAGLNDFANSTFQSSGGITTSDLIDQAANITGQGSSGSQFQDPVSQAVANMLTTPDSSYCITKDSNNAPIWNTTICPAGNLVFEGNNLMTDDQVMQNVIGSLPSTWEYFTPKANQLIIPQLNSNNLIAPLMYSNEALNLQTQYQSNTPPIFSGQQSGPLQAQNPEQLASNFIRYATAGVAPISLPDRQSYDNLYKQLLTPTPATAMQRFQAAATLANFLTNIRVYAAQTSVGIGNLYYILSRRMQQPISTAAQGAGQSNSITTSQALSEYQMATWRLINPQNKQQNTDWINKLNSASAATTQKEIALLLAEINYQLYLSRQQDERILLTNTMLLLQNARMMQLNGLLRATSDTAAANNPSNQ
ncbi:hypothetical protein [Legionella cardiaca]|uniref:Intracellular multiplication protein IcmX n=1 Tax=Legionella cardiaca TaxID=1071983 RepID=A0ABY8API2_9GAMM|nr:hypothetical protein [Legionella cardiaca]WED42443.1 hypothetical protein PXX05_11020 [Legionella cardiaca]